MPTLLIRMGQNTPSRIGFGCAALALVLPFVCAPAAQTENENLAGVIGLLTMAPLVGEPCKEPPGRQIPLYAAPKSGDLVGWIRADKDASSDADCYRVVLNVHRPGAASADELPTEEYEEEEPHAAIVLETRGRWFKLRLSDGAAWLETPDQAKYFSLEQLLGGHAAYLTDAWDGKLAATAGGVSRRPPADPRRHIVGYVEPVLERLRVVPAPGQTTEEIRQRYHASSMESEVQPNGTRIFHIERGTPVRAFELPDPGARVVASFQTDACGSILRSISNPPEVPVFDRRPGWLQVALRHDEWRDGWRDEWQNEPRVWIEDTLVWRVHAFDGDAEREEFATQVLGPQYSSVRLVGSRTIGATLWLHIALTSHSEDDPADPPRVLASGWLPAHDPAGQPVVWFYSRD